MERRFIQELIETPFTDDYQPAHQKGPDYVLPATDHRTWFANGAVKIRSIDPGHSLKSIVTFFRETVEQVPNSIALVTTRSGFERKWTFLQYMRDVEDAAKGFIKLGLAPFHGVGILGYNAPEWQISHLAAIFAGGFSAGIYTSNSPAACFHVLNNCEANLVVVENELQLEKILQIRDSLPQLKAIIQYSGKPTHPDVISWVELLEIGRSVPDNVLSNRVKGLAINQCAVIIYTSGTTGNPKGVMLSHDNILTWVHATVPFFLHPVGENEKIVSYLPLSHILAVSVDVYIGIYSKGTVYFTGPDALKGQLLNYTKQVRPTLFMTVPRLVEKIYENLQIVETSMPYVKRALFKWALNQCFRHHNNRHVPKLSFSLAKKLVADKVKKQLGLNEMRTFVFGGAPLTKEIKDYFLGLDIVMLHIYGLSESTGGHVGNSHQDHKTDSMGNINTIKTQKTKILNPDEEGNGEILLSGPNIFMGYLKLENETLETIDDEQWLHTGDTGTVDKNGYLRITGRIKELIITSGGENIPPLIIEETVKQLLPVISNCIVIGDNRNYLTMLLTLKTEMDMDTNIPTDKLSPTAVAWCKSVGSDAGTVEEILKTKDENVFNAIQAGITKYNESYAISNAQRIQKWIILPKDFCVANGEFGPTVKMIRPFIVKKYRNEIEGLYSNN